MYTVRQYGDNTAKIIWHKSLRDSGWESERPSKKKGSVNNGKLENNLCRAKSTVRELALCNDWDYWCTFTLAPDKHNRYDLESYKKIWVSLYTIIIGAVNLNMPLDIYLFLKSIRWCLAYALAL